MKNKKLVFLIISLILFMATNAYAINIKGSYRGTLYMKSSYGTGCYTPQSWPTMSYVLTNVKRKRAKTSGIVNNYPAKGKMTKKGFYLKTNFVSSIWRFIYKSNLTKITRKKARINYVGNTYYASDNTRSCKYIFKGTLTRIR